MLTFTVEHTAVIDIFAGCGSLGVVCAERHRHCLCIDYDRPLFDHHLGRFVDIALTPIAATLLQMMRVRIQIGSSMIPWLDYDISHFSFLFMTFLFIWEIWRLLTIWFTLTTII